MINLNIEQNLKEYCVKQNDSSFNNIHDFLKYQAAYICRKYKVHSDIEIHINDMVSEISIKLPLKYKPELGLAKNLVFVIMSQYLLNSVRYEQRYKRKIHFLQDLEEGLLFELEVDELEFYKTKLFQEKNNIFIHLKTPLSIKIADSIFEFIETPKKNINYLKYITKKCKCHVNSVYNCINEIKILCHASPNTQENHLL